MVHRKPFRTRLLRLLALIVFAPLILAVFVLAVPIIIVAGAWDKFRRGRLRREFLLAHGRHRKRGVLVYSNSPNWQSYIEERWLPRLADRVVLINWSERAMWPPSALETTVFRRFGGNREFNPLAIIFHDPAPSTLGAWFSAIRRRDVLGIISPHAADTEVVRFWKAFRDFKHGKDRALKDAERKMFTALGIA